MNRKKPVIAVLICLVLVLCMASSLLAAPGHTRGLLLQASGTPAFQIRSCAAIMQEQKTTWKEWTSLTQKSKATGLEDPVTLEEIREADPAVQIKQQDDGVYYLNGRLPIKARDAAEAVCSLYRLLPVLGGRTDADLQLLSEVRIDDHNIYVFQEMYNGQTVLGSTVRLAAEEDGSVVTVFSSLAKGLPEIGTTQAADAAGAEQSVENYLAGQHINAAVLPEYTEQILMAQDDEEAEDALPDLITWAVYTDNPEYSETAGSFPYLAHYVSADGTWLCSMEVKEPCDEAGRLGYSSVYLFDRMEPAFWTGEVTDADGTTRTITVPVMHDTLTGDYILGDVERRIAVGEFYDFEDEDRSIVMVSSPDNSVWPEDDLLTLDNYIAAWDYYAALGWIGPDGQGTPTLLLRNMCFENGDPMDNAAYAGKYYGWQIFAYDNVNYGLGKALDIIAHEFTHAVTSVLQGTNLYYNDYGAINESLSDIMGSLCEMEVEGSGHADWLIGEDVMSPIRSLLDPHDYNQPEYVWDIFYGPAVTKPNDINDRGGVHGNSSILNRLAAKMVEDAGMSAAQARDFWLTVMCGVTPMTDLPQMADVLEWALAFSGNAAFSEELREQIAFGQLTRTQIPEQLPDSQKLITLKLPDTADMQDPNWVMMALQLNVDSIFDILGLLATLFIDEDSTDFMENGLLSLFTSWASDENGTIRLITRDRQALYLLLNLDPDTMDFHGAAVLSGDTWIDLLGMIPLESTENTALAEDALDNAVQQLLSSGLDIILDLFTSFLFSEESADTAAGSNAELPSAGLEGIRLAE